jgi:iron(III) transport system ATP-binding protein
MNVLTVNDLHLDYGSGATANPILKGVSMHLQRGEVVALLGPSGSGKTTLLRAVAGLESPKSGTIDIGERRVFDGSRKLELPAESRNLGLVFQSYALWPHMTVAKNLAFPLTLRKVPAAEQRRRIGEALELVDLGDYADRFPHELSGGQQQRVALARTLVFRPSLLLLDEPLSNLDAKLRIKSRALLKSLQRQLGLTTIYVTHDQEEALSLADRIVVLRDGQVRQVGTPQELFARPDYIDVAEFMGFRNRIEGRVAAVDGDYLTLDVGQVRISGRALANLPVGAPVVAAIRPEDLHPVATSSGGLGITVTSTEFCGREFAGFGRSADGAKLFFRAPGHIAHGASIHLGAAPDRVLVYAGQAA